MNTPVIILTARGTNRDRDAALACRLAGAAPEIVHVNQIVAGERRLDDYRLLVIPGGFSYGDDLGAGKLWAVVLRHRLGDELAAFVEAGRPVLGICNGFQVLVKSGLLPGPLGLDDEAPVVAPARPHSALPEQSASLTRNDSARFECRWVVLGPDPASPCVFTRDLAEPIHCPVAHGEGKFVARDPAVLAAIEAGGLAALRYFGPDGRRPAPYPWNPNGSEGDIAGICNARGNVLGLMPHPENHVRPDQHPQRQRGHRGGLGLALFEKGIAHAAQR